MFDLDGAVRTWREEVAARHTLSAADIDELEDHLLLRHRALMMQGRAPEVAWAQAREGLGAPVTLAEEYVKVSGSAWRRLMQAAWALFAVSWVMPVISLGGDESAPGWWAFWQALTGELGVVGALTALTNAVMLRTLWRPSDLDGHRLAASTAAMLAAAILNGWYLMSDMTDGNPATLMAGYYVWWASFGLAAAGLVQRLRSLGVRAAVLSVG